MDSKRLLDGRWLRVKATKRREFKAEGKRPASSMFLGEMTMTVKLTGEEDARHKSVFSSCPLCETVRDQIRTRMEIADKDSFEFCGWHYEWEKVDDLGEEDGSTA